MCWSGCALQRLLGVTPVHLVLSPENPCRTLDPRAKFRVLYRIERKVRASAVQAHDLGPTSRAPVCWSGCPVAFGLKPGESVPHLGPQGRISYFNQDSANSEAPPFAPPTSAQLAGSASVLPRVSPPTPSRRNPVAFGLKPQESVPHLGPQGQISYFNQDSANAKAPPFVPPTSAQLAGSASVLPRVSPPTPSRCNPVAFGLKPRESVPHFWPQCQILYFNQDSANSEAPPFAPPTSAQLAGSASVLPRVSPPTPSRRNPVAFGLKPQESVPHLGPQGQISYFNQDSANAKAAPFAPPTSAQLAGSASVPPQGGPSNTF